MNTLYEIKQDKQVSEREEVNAILKKHFIISNDPKNRIRACELYAGIIRYLVSLFLINSQSVC